MFHLCRIVALLCCLSPTRGLRSIPQYARDMSEHCKRRDALPSVFLSRRVMGAQVLHFSKLDTPYSCFTTVRSEAGHSIIMVLETFQEGPEYDYCQDSYQLAVYDFTETFGGYWGPMPDMIFEEDAERKFVNTKQYTLATKPPTTTSTTPKPIIVPNVSKLSTTVPTRPAETQSFIHVDVPLVNFSASMVPNNEQYEEPAFDQDEFFDLFYDVLPRSKQPYESSIVPLVKIALKPESGRREGNDSDVGDGEPRYQLEYDIGPITPDQRLTIPAWSTKINTNRNANRWKKKKLQDKRPSRPREPKPNQARTRKLKQYSLPTTIDRSPYDLLLPQPITERKYEEANQKNQEPVNLIDDIMKLLNESGDLLEEQSTDSDILTILNASENSYHNLSVYLAPFPTYTFLPVSEFPVNITKNQSENPSRGNTNSTFALGKSSVFEQENDTPYKGITYKKTYSTEPTKVKLDGDLVTEKEITTPINKIEVVKLTTLSTRDVTTASQPTAAHENQEEDINSSSSTSSVTESAVDGVIASNTTADKRSLTGTLVDHESWENVVQSAPVMAGLLNQHDSVPGSSPDVKPSDDRLTAQKQRRLRRKRHISVIAVDAARPHRRSSPRTLPTHATVFHVDDMHDFARLLELPDDQMNNHVLIQMSDNMSSPLFDMCNASNAMKTRFLVLFNSSRVILSIANFSMSHVMVVLTAARPLSVSESQCPDPLVECQVEGTRLCIDNTNACDGVPNCGSAYAYDEDRVLCGVIEQSHNVYLAAVTCLAVLVTMVYVIHYWLQRCVPNVAEAFFVYADSADNELYLDSIMRSPTDVAPDDDHYLYNSALFDDENLPYSHASRKSVNVFKRLFSHLPDIGFLLFNRGQRSSRSLEDLRFKQSSTDGVAQSKHSFTEPGLRSMMSAGKIDQEVQTGESIEMAYLKVINSYKKGESEKKSAGLQHRQPSIHEVPLRNFATRRTGSFDTSTDSPGQSTSLNVASGEEEQEIQSTFYYPGKIIQPKKLSTDTRETRGRKFLRFNEHTTLIPRQDDNGEEQAESAPAAARRPSGFGYSGRSVKRLQPNKADDNNATEHGSSDFRKFFRKKRDHK